MNTSVELTAWTKCGRLSAKEYFFSAFCEFERIAKQFTRFDVSSELYKFNKNSGKINKVSKELFFLIENALNYAKRTSGYFDPTVIDFLETYGYDLKYNFKKLENRNLRTEIQNILEKRPSFNEIKLEKKRLSIKLAEKQKIDLGGIGKGYAIDLAFGKLKPLGNFLINAGGDIKAFGNSPDVNGWPVGLNVPETKSIGAIILKNEALCCSGSWARKVRSFHHLLNPKSGIPQNDFKTVFVKSARAIDADAWSTTLFVMGEKAVDFAQRNGLKVLFVSKSNDLTRINFPVT